MKKLATIFPLLILLSIYPLLAQPDIGVHPSYKVTNLRPSGFEERVSGIDFLPNGSMVMSVISSDNQQQIDDFRSHRQNLPGKALLMENVLDGNPTTSNVSVFRDGLVEPLGITVVNGRVFVGEHDAMTELIDANGDGIAEAVDTLATGWLSVPNQRIWVFGPHHKDGFLYMTVGAKINSGIQDPTDDPDLKRGVMIKVNLATKELEDFAHGFRNANGINSGPGGEIFATDNEGRWLPQGKLTHVSQGNFYGSQLSSLYNNQQENYPAVNLPREFSPSPTEPILVREGPYKGQMFFGEIALGGIKRANLEKVNGVYQGAAFDFTGGLESGINSLKYGPDGHLYLGGIGNGENGNWGWKNKYSGLQRLEYIQNDVFDMLAIYSRANGLEVEFTKPLQNNITAANFFLKRWWYLPTATYGGPKQDEDTLAIQSVQVSPDRKRVLLQFNGLQTNRVFHIAVNNILSSTGDTLWQKEGYYTLNSISTTQAFQIGGCMNSQFGEFNPNAVYDDGSCTTPVRYKFNYSPFSISTSDLNIEVSAQIKGIQSVSLFDIRGQRIQSLNGYRLNNFSFTNLPGKGIYLIRITALNQTYSQTVAVY